MNDYTGTVKDLIADCYRAGFRAGWDRPDHLAVPDDLLARSRYYAREPGDTATIRRQRDEFLADLNEAHQLLQRIDDMAAQLFLVDATSLIAADIREAIDTYFNLGTTA